MIEVCGVDRPPKRPARDRSENPARTRLFFLQGRRTTDEDLATARRIAGSCHIGRAADAQRGQMKQPGHARNFGRQIVQRRFERHHEILDRSLRTRDERRRHQPGARSDLDRRRPAAHRSQSS